MSEDIREARPDTEELGARDLWLLAAKALLGLALLAGIVAIVAHWFRDEVAFFAKLLCESLGPVGIAAGVFIADGFNFPVPVQAYLLAIVAQGAGTLPALVAVCIGSLAGGHAGFALGAGLSRRPRVARFLERVSKRGGRFLERHGYQALIIGGFLPLPYSILCWAAGLRRISYPRFAWFVLLRIPKLFLYYAMVRAGWTH